jgi:hypothetical protein
MDHWIGVDLDGTLAHYKGWQGIEHIGDPIQPMVDRVRSLLNRGYKVKIFTARVCREEEREKVIEVIHKWLMEKAKLPPLEVTNVKDFGMISLYDDRAIQVELNTGRIKFDVHMA